jgi:hypothetical protein
MAAHGFHKMINEEHDTKNRVEHGSGEAVITEHYKTIYYSIVTVSMMRYYRSTAYTQFTLLSLL